MSEDRTAFGHLLDIASNDNHEHFLDRIHALATRAVDDPSVVTPAEIQDIAWIALLFVHREIQRGAPENMADQIRRWQKALRELAT